MFQKPCTLKIPSANNQISSVLTLKVGDLCFGKVRGYPEWPGVVIKVENGVFWVKFFNSDLK